MWAAAALSELCDLSPLAHLLEEKAPARSHGNRLQKWPLRCGQKNGGEKTASSFFFFFLLFLLDWFKWPQCFVFFYIFFFWNLLMRGWNGAGFDLRPLCVRGLLFARVNE